MCKMPIVNHSYSSVRLVLIDELVWNEFVLYLFFMEIL